MLIGTHMLLPVSGCLVIDNVSLARRGERWFPGWSLFAVAFFGALPDVCTPHLSLEARYDSWSHGVAFLVALLPLAGMAGSVFEKGARLRVAAACWLAAFLHVAADAVAGGIPWLYPWSPWILGEYWIPPQHWMAYDAAFVLLTWFLARVSPHMLARRLEKNRLKGKQETERLMEP